LNQVVENQSPDESIHCSSQPGTNVLFDVELPITVSFGRAERRLIEAAALTRGTLIELDRTVEDPVELLINNHVIARGDIVVIEGHYGFVITELVSLEVRLQQSQEILRS
jgi:flagellar motor switch protein FliN/FliY